MILIGSLNWDESIARFNLQNPDKGSIDVEYLFTLSDDVLPILNENKDVLDNEFMFSEGWRRNLNNGMQELNTRTQSFLEKQDGYSWLSWNYTDWKTKQYFAKQDFRRTIE